MIDYYYCRIMWKRRIGIGVVIAALVLGALIVGPMAGTLAYFYNTQVTGNHTLSTWQCILWLQTTTVGLRINKITKKMLNRDITKKTTKHGTISVKNAYLRGKIIKSKPEYEDCRRLAKEKGVTVKEIYDSILPEDD